MAMTQYKESSQPSNPLEHPYGYPEKAPIGYQETFLQERDASCPSQQMPQRYRSDIYSGPSRLKPQSQWSASRDGRFNLDAQQPPSYYPADRNVYHDPRRYSDTPPLSNDSLYPPQSYSNAPRGYIQLSPSHSPRPLSPLRNKLIAIPATATAPGSPFLRSYAQSLESHHISQGTFLTFLDRLNHVTKDSPPLQVLGVAGQLVGFLPIPSAQLISLGISAASKLGNVAMTKGRTEMFMSESNKQLFEPRGLRVEICKIDALAKLSGMPLLSADGLVDKEAPLWKDLSDCGSNVENELNVLSPWVETLELCPESTDIDPNASGMSVNLKKFGKFAKDAKQKRDDSKAQREAEKEAERRERRGGRGKDDRRGGKGKASSTESTLWLVIKETKPAQTSV